MAAPHDISRPSEPGPGQAPPPPGVPTAPVARTSIEFTSTTTDGTPQYRLEAEVKFVSHGDALKTSGSGNQAVIKGDPDVVREQLLAALRHLEAGTDRVRLMPAESTRRTA